MVLYFLFCCPHVHCLYVDVQLIYVCLFCIMKLIRLLVLLGYFFFVESLEFSMKKIVSTANKDSFISSFLICMPFISFYCLMALIRTSSTMSNKSSEIDIFFLVPDLRQKEYSLSTLGMLAVHFCGCSLQLRNVSCIPILLRVFTMREYGIMSNIFFFFLLQLVLLCAF